MTHPYITFGFFVLAFLEQVADVYMTNDNAKHGAVENGWASVFLQKVLKSWWPFGKFALVIALGAFDWFVYPIDYRIAAVATFAFTLVYIPVVGNQYNIYKSNHGG